MNRSQILKCGNWERDHYNSVLKIRRPRSFISWNTYIGTRHLYWIFTGPSIAVHPIRVPPHYISFLWYKGNIMIDELHLLILYRSFELKNRRFPTLLLRKNNTASVIPLHQLDGLSVTFGHTIFGNWWFFDQCSVQIPVTWKKLIKKQ
jgi:hypothetical protein